MAINDFWFTNYLNQTQFNYTSWFNPYNICTPWYTNEFSWTQPIDIFRFLQPQNPIIQPGFQVKQPTFQIKQPSFTLNNYNFDTFIKTTPTQAFSISTGAKASLSEYNASSGKKLAQIALRDSVGFNESCATYVKNAIKNAGLGSYQYGDAYMTTSILNNNKNFKQIPTEGVNVKTLPAGCVLVYDRGVAGYSSEYGHTEITTGDGRAVSDGITNNPRQNPSAIFIPV